MSDTPDTQATESEAAETDVAVVDPLQEWADALVEELGALGSTVEFDTVRIHVEPGKWVETINTARRKLELFSWLSAIDWSKNVEVGETVDDVDGLEERFEVLCRLSSVENADGAIFVTVIDRQSPSIDSLMPTIAGAEWHEREAHEMFGIDFVGNTNLIPLYLPDDFIGHPLLKSYPLISREVKPWPGDVDVEPMPEVAGEQADEESDDQADDAEGSET
jgi:NADH-quinone oxidoreductase subunit C